MKFNSSKKKRKKSVYKAGSQSRSVNYGVDSYNSASVHSNYGGGASGVNPRRDNATKSSSRRQKKKGGAGLVILIIFLVALVGAGVFVGLEVTGNIAKADGEIVVTLPSGASTGDVAQILYDNELIGNTTMFKAYSRITGNDGTYQEGNHTVTGGMSYSEIIEILQQTTYVEIETFTMTFPEGTTALKMAMMLEEEGVCTIEEFIDACNNDTFDVSFYDQISDNSLKFIKLEGFLYPDTYEFEVGSSVHDIILTMLQNFESKVFTEKIQADLANSKYSLEEIVILASIIQKESIDGEEYRISSVFNNRLDADNHETNGCLQSCTTGDRFRPAIGGYIPNVLGYYYGSIDNIPEGMAEAYDSYNTPGLMVGAISNPEAKMLDAALNPDDTPYFYFITGADGKFYYGETLDDHNRNIEEHGLAEP